MSGSTSTAGPAPETEQDEILELLKNLRRALPALTKLLEEVKDHWCYEDGIYRFYHQSFKVFHLQQKTLEIVEALKKLTPRPAASRTREKFWSYRAREKTAGATPLHPWFMKIVGEGTGKVFDVSHNENWLAVARPIVEAFLHAKYFLEMAVKYGGRFRSRTPKLLPSGWAAFLYLYDLR